MAPKIHAGDGSRIATRMPAETAIISARTNCPVVSIGG